MKTINYFLALMLTVASFGAFAQAGKVNAEKSTITWLGKKVVGEHAGAISLKSGAIELKDEVIISGSFTIDMATISCTDLEDPKYNKKLVGHLKADDFFGVEKFPTADFVVTKAAKFSNGKASVTGDLTIKGKTEPVTFDVVKTENTYTATIAVDRTKYDIKYGSASFFDSLGDKAIDNIFTLDATLVVNQ